MRKLASKFNARLAQAVWPIKSSKLKETIDRLERRKSNLSLCLGSYDRVTSNIKELPYAVEAEVSQPKSAKPHCLPNTRVKLLKVIFDWMIEPISPTIFWLKGMAGTGKSTVARIFATEAAEEKQNLVVSFCLSCGTGDLERSKKVLITIAAQLAHKSRSRHPALRGQISSAISKDAELPIKGLSEQWKHLIIEPLIQLDQALKNPLHITLVLDALDECKDEEDIRLILKLLPQAKMLQKIQFRVFATSRPEIAVVSGFRSITNDDLRDFVLHNIEHSIADGDTRKFIEHKFDIIRNDLNPKDRWPPSEDKLNLLVSQTAQLFIFASTACLFILRMRYFHPSDSLALLLQDSPVAETVEGMDQLYETILIESTLRDSTGLTRKSLAAKFREFVGPLVVILDVLPRQSYFHLVDATGKYDQELTRVLEDLQSVLDVPEDPKSPIQLLHPSFRDFLVTPGRASDHFLINELRTHGILAGRCLKLMSSGLKNNMCNLKPGCPPSAVTPENLEKVVNPELRYACLYWVEHLQRGLVRLTDDEEDPQSALVHGFLRNNLLQWLEVLSLITRPSDAVHMIYSLESIVLVSKERFCLMMQ